MHICVRTQDRSGQTTKCLSINRIIGLYGDHIVWSINSNIYELFCNTGTWLDTNVLYHKFIESQCSGYKGIHHHYVPGFLINIDKGQLVCVSSRLGKWSSDILVCLISG